MKNPSELLKELEKVVNTVRGKAISCDAVGISKDVTSFNDLFRELNRGFAVRIGSSLTDEQETKLRHLKIEYELAFEDIESKCLCKRK